jgi:hypothetical protein
VGITLKEQVQYLAPHLSAYADTLTPCEIEFQHMPLQFEANRDYGGFDDEVSVITNPQHLEPTFPNEIELEPWILEAYVVFDDEVSEVTIPQDMEPTISHEIELKPQIALCETSKAYDDVYDDEVSEVTDPQYMETTFQHEIEYIPQIVLQISSAYNVIDDEESEEANPQYMELICPNQIFLFETSKPDDEG